MQFSPSLLAKAMLLAGVAVVGSLPVQANQYVEIGPGGQTESEASDQFSKDGPWPLLNGGTLELVDDNSNPYGGGRINIDYPVKIDAGEVGTFMPVENINYFGWKFNLSGGENSVFRFISPDYAVYFCHGDYQSKCVSKTYYQDGDMPAASMAQFKGSEIVIDGLEGARFKDLDTSDMTLHFIHRSRVGQYNNNNSGNQIYDKDGLVRVAELKGSNYSPGDSGPYEKNLGLYFLRRIAGYSKPVFYNADLKTGSIDFEGTLYAKNFLGTEASDNWQVARLSSSDIESPSYPRTETMVNLGKGSDLLVVGDFYVHGGGYSQLHRIDGGSFLKDGEYVPFGEEDIDIAWVTWAQSVDAGSGSGGGHATRKTHFYNWDLLIWSVKDDGGTTLWKPDPNTGLPTDEIKISDCKMPLVVSSGETKDCDVLLDLSAEESSVEIGEGGTLNVKASKFTYPGIYQISEGGRLNASVLIGSDELGDKIVLGGGEYEGNGVLDIKAISDFEEIHQTSGIWEIDFNVVGESIQPLFNFDSGTAIIKKAEFSSVLSPDAAKTKIELADEAELEVANGIDGKSLTLELGDRSSADLSGFSADSDYLDAEGGVEEGGIYLGALTGSGSVYINKGSTLNVGYLNNKDDVFSGDLNGAGSFAKRGTGSLILSGENSYEGSTSINSGTLMLGNAEAIPEGSTTTVQSGALLHLNNQAPTIDSITLNGGAGSGTLKEMMFDTATIKGGVLTGTITSKGGLLSGVSGADLNVESGRTFIRDMKSGTLGNVVVTGGQLWAADDDQAMVANLTLNTESFTPVDPRNDDRTLGPIQDGLVLGFDDDESAALKVTDKFTYSSGNVYLYKPASEAGEDYEGTWNLIDFKEGDLTDDEYEKMFANTYLMYETPDGDLEYFKFAANGTPANADLLREVNLKKGSLKVVVGGEIEIPDDKEQEIEDEISGSIDFEDDALDDIANEFELWTADELVEVVQRGLLPRNVDGAGQTLATYNNLLADTIFERTPMRQFTEVEPEVADEPAPVAEPEVEPVPVGEPVRGLWSKSGAVDDGEADAYLAEKTGGQPLVIADAQTTADHQEQHLIEINGKTYAENDSLTAEYADRDGVRGWFRGFGGQSADSNGESDTTYNPYGISAGGGIVGADVSLSESLQLGAYASYGDINLWQSSGVEGLGGGWNADGWGGGVTADYWTNNFYVQGLLGASGFSGEQKRSIKGYGVLFDDETAKGEKSASTMVGALRIGAPFQSGSTYFEPQFTATWTGNSENRFSESADDDRLGLTYKSRTTNYLQTALGMKLAWPIKTGTTGLLTPSVKVAWLGDWNQNNEDQRIGFDFTDKTYAVSSNQEDVKGALLEAGLDYSVAQVEGTSVKAYVRGGAELWGGSRGTQWRASGGVTFQF